MNSNNKKQNSKIKSSDLKDKTDNIQTIEKGPAQKDGFRYDYNDSSDF